MLFPDEDTRHNYHQSESLLQVVCGIFESDLSRHAHQCTVLGVDIDGEKHMALVQVEDCAPLIVMDAIDHLNASFVRTDGQPTCLPLDKEQGQVMIMVTSATDFAQAH